MNLRPLVHRILEDYALPWHGTHGMGHWARVLVNGLRLAEQTGANIHVVQLFAVFHDSRRINETTDFGHGRRGAEFAAILRDDLFSLPDDEFDLLHEACAGHTDGETSGNISIQTCWDADRLDLGRVGIMPEPRRLCTDAAKKAEMIEWADGRASSQVVPDFVREQWRIDLDGFMRSP